MDRNRAARRIAWLFVARRAATVAVAISVLAFVAGCGLSTQSGSSAPGSGGAPTKNCGTVIIHGSNPPTDASARQDESCFYTSYQTCDSATLTVTDMGVDAGTTRTFTTAANNGKCTLTDRVSTYVIPRPTPTPATFTCSGLAQQSDGLHFSACGVDGDVFVPAPKS